MIEINIQMPERCGLCPCFHSENPMYCQAVKADKNKKIVAPYGTPRPEWCPMKEQKVKTGKWIEQTDYFGDTYYDCSVCNESWITIEGTPWVNGMNYCPHCGAKMEFEGR